MTPVTLHKTTDTTITIGGVTIPVITFINKMSLLGFDIDITYQTIRCLSIGGKWHLTLTGNQVSFITNRPTTKPLGFW